MTEALIINDLCFHHPSKRPGTLKISRKSIDLTLFDFRVGDRGAEWMPKSVQLQTAGHAALFDIQFGGTGWSRSTEIISRNGVSAQRAIIGGRVWRDTDRAAAVEFMLSDTAALFSYRGHVKRSYKTLSASKDRTIETHDFDREEIMKVDCGEYMVSIGLRPHIYSRSHDLLGERHTIICVEFSTPVELTTAYHVIFHLRIFCMLAIGKPCRRYGMTVTTETDRERRNDTNCFAVYDIHNDEIFEANEESLFTCSTGLNRNHLRTALLAWMTRRDQWNLTYWLIDTFIRDSKFYDRNRLIRVMAWFESLPDFQGKEPFPTSKLDKLRKAVSALAEFKSLDLDADRLSILGELRRVPLMDRLERAFKEMRLKYGKTVFSAELLEYCKLARKYRDEAAHGGHGESVDNFPKLAMATAAVETLTLACTCAALGVSKDKMGRIAHSAFGHPFARFAGFLVSARNKGIE